MLEAMQQTDAERRAEYQEFIHQRFEAGEDPNQMQDAFEEALQSEADARDWALFGTGRYYRDYVCSICGSWTYGLCGPKCTNQPDRAKILRSEFVRRRDELRGREE